MRDRILNRIIKWFQFKRYNWKSYDYSLVAVVIILTLVSTFILSKVQTGFSPIRQIFALVLGLIIIFIFSIFDYHDLCMYAPIIYIITTLMAAATKLSPLGTDQGTGSFRWLDLGIAVQPSEVCKISIILMLAVFFNKKTEKGNIKEYKNFFIAVAITLIPTFFILIQSDLSSSVVIIMILVMMLTCSGIGHKILGSIAAVVVPIFAFLFWYIQQPNQILLTGSHAYQLERIMAWLHPDGHELGLMFQQNNSILSIASGQLYGKIMEDTADATRNYNSVGVTESDFIWTPISEEFGFLGCMVILILLSIIIIKCFIKAKKANDYLGMMIAAGIGAMFCFQSFFNIGVTTLLLPNTGLPLPFLSYGMSSLLGNMMAIGILINITINPSRGGNMLELDL